MDELLSEDTDAEEMLDGEHDNAASAGCSTIPMSGSLVLAFFSLIATGRRRGSQVDAGAGAALARLRR